MLAGAVFFALMGVQAHALGPRCDWLIVALARVLFMFVSSAVMAVAAGQKLVFLRPTTLWLRSLCGSFSLVCNFFAMTKLPVSDALTLNSIYPLWILLIVAIWTRRVPRFGEVLGVACALVGVVLVQRPHLEGDRLAATAAVLSSASTAVALLGLHRLRGVDSRAVVAHFAGVASLVAGIWLFFFRKDAIWEMRGDLVTIALLAGVCVSGTLGQLCLTRAYATGVPTKIAVIGLSQIAFAAVFDVVIWAHTFTPTSLVGMALVLAPTALLMTSAQGRLAALGRSGHGRDSSSKDQTKHEENDEDKKENPREGLRLRGNPSEAENPSDDRDDQRRQRPAQHDEVLER
jgi:drug/metabolite transporter (DMT)-like permease